MQNVASIEASEARRSVLSKRELIASLIAGNQHLFSLMRAMGTCDPAAITTELLLIGGGVVAVTGIILWRCSAGETPRGGGDARHRGYLRVRSERVLRRRAGPLLMSRALILILAVSSFGCTAVADLSRFEFVDQDSGPAAIDDAGVDASMPVDASDDMDAAEPEAGTGDIDAGTDAGSDGGADIDAAEPPVDAGSGADAA